MEIPLDFNISRWPKSGFIEEPRFHQFWFEKVDTDFWSDYVEIYGPTLLALGVPCYVVFIYVLKRLMKDKEPFNLRLPLFLYNLSVGCLSLFIFQRIGSEALIFLKEPQGFYRSICKRDGLHESSFFYAVVFSWTKPFFVIDTIFLVLRKKPIDIVHVVHHSLSIIGTPIVTSFQEPILRWFGMSNLLVHAIDYNLLALRALQIYVPKSREIMAGLEIGQMIYVLSISAYTLYMRQIGVYCYRHTFSVNASLTIYITLLVAVIITFLNPDYWRRGIQRFKSRSKCADSKSE